MLEAHRFGAADAEPLAETGRAATAPSPATRRSPAARTRAGRPSRWPARRSAVTSRISTGAAIWASTNRSRVAERRGRGVVGAEATPAPRATPTPPRLDGAARAAAARRHQAAEATVRERLGLLAAAHAHAVEAHVSDALVAGAVAVVVLDHAAGELDVEHRQLGFVGAEAPELGVVGHRVEAAAAVGGGASWSARAQVAWATRAVGLTELAVERGPQHDPVLLHPEAGELAGRDRRRVHVPREVHRRRSRRCRPARERAAGSGGGPTTGSGSSSGAAGGGTGMWISRFGSPIRPMPAPRGSAAHVRDHILRDVADRVEGLLA